MRIKVNIKIKTLCTVLKCVLCLWFLFVSVYFFCDIKTREICDIKTREIDFNEFGKCENFEKFRRNTAAQLKQMRIENNRYFFLQQMFTDLRINNIRIAPEYWRLLSRSEFNIRSYKVVDVKLADIRVCSGRDIEFGGATQATDDINSQNQNNEVAEMQGNSSNDFDAIRFAILTKEMSNSTYDVSKAIIVVDSKNCVLDGYHRAKILQQKYRKDYKIKVLKLYF